jgi:hypothetical protein
MKLWVKMELEIKKRKCDKIDSKKECKLELGTNLAI